MARGREVLPELALHPRCAPPPPPPVSLPGESRPEAPESPNEVWGVPPVPQAPAAGCAHPLPARCSHSRDHPAAFL